MKKTNSSPHFSGWCSIAVFVILATLSVSANAEFASRRIRYVSAYDTVNLLVKNFPGHPGDDRKTAIPYKCESVNSTNRDVLGVSSTLSGQPLMDKPNPGFIRWLNQCLATYVKFEFIPGVAYRASFAKEYLPAAMAAADLQSEMRKPWTSVARKDQNEILERITKRLIGPSSVYAALYPGRAWSDLLSSLEKTANETMPPSATTGMAMATIAHTIFLRDEFLRY